MVYIKWTFLAVIAAVIIAFFDYTLPQHDVVRINRAYETQVTVGDNSIFWAGTAPGEADPGGSRYVNLIETFTPANKTRVFRNEDTGWSWPPYFKFDTSNLQAEAGDLKSTKADPQWVVVTHYGWRSEYLSIYPNAVKLRAIDGPEVTIIPWLNIIILGMLALFVGWVWRIWTRFKEDRIEPLMDDAGEFIDSVDDRAEGIWKRIFGGRRG